MPDRWFPPDGERPQREVQLLAKAAKLLQCDLREFDSTVSLTVQRNPDGTTVVELDQPSYAFTAEISIIADPSQAKTTVMLAEMVLDSALFEDYYDAWPSCPIHPTAPHSLVPVARGHVGAWMCPESKKTVALVGELASEKL